jgi:hypothetical protein
MLEEADLHIGPWLPGPGPGDGSRGTWMRRRISVRGQALGFACRRHGAWSWLVRRVVEVYETEDASLLLTLRPRWWRRAWDVVDAENRVRGGVYRAWLLDDAEQSLALVQLLAQGREARFMHPSGRDLGTCTKSGDNVHLRFAGELDPFTRMILLGAALLLW